MRISLIVAVALATLTACATEVKAPTASVVASLSVNTGSVAQLDGSASSDPAGRPLAFDWSFTSLPAGSRAALNDPTVARPSFTPDVPGTYQVQLVVSNGVQQSPAAKVTVTASTCGAARPNAQVHLLSPEAAGPAASVGPVRIPVGAVVSASGVASNDPDNAAPCSAGQTLTYRWALDAIPAGATATLNSATAVNPTFTAGAPGTYVLGLVVTDSTGLASTEATLTVVADPAFGAVLPVAGFSIQTINAGTFQAMNGPRGLAVDAAGAVYVAQSGTARVTKHQAGAVSILAEGAHLGEFRTTLDDVALDTTQAAPRLLVTSGPQIVAVDPTTGGQSVFVNFNFGGGGQDFRGIAVGVTATTNVLSTWRVAAVDNGNDQILLFDPAAPAAAPTAVPFGPATVVSPWGVAMLSPAAGTAAGAATWFTTSNQTGPNQNGTIEKLAAGVTTALLSSTATGSLDLRRARDLALSPCATPKLFVANGGGVLVVDTTTGAFQTLVTGLGAPAGLAFDTSGASPALLVTDDLATKNALYRIDGPFCSL